MDRNFKDGTVDKINELFDNAKPEDKDYLQKLNVAARLQANVNELEKIENQDYEKQLDIEAGNKDRFLKYIEIGITAIVGVANIIFTQIRFNRATKKEFDEPITGIANRTEVQEDLRQDSSKKFKLF